MNDNPFYLFIEFVERDQKIEALKKQLQILEQDIAHLKEQDDFQAAAVEAARLVAHALRKNLDNGELEAQELREQEKTKKIRLDVVTSPREYTSLHHELATIEEKLTTHEEALFALWQEYEQAEKLYRELQATYATSHDVARVAIADKKSRFGQEHKELESLMIVREQYKERILPEWLERYERMRQSVANPVVPLAERYCSGCSYEIPAQDIIALGHHKIITCKNCYRLLYSL